MWRRKCLPSGFLLLRTTTSSVFAHGFAPGNPSFFSKDMCKTTQTASFGDATFFSTDSEEGEMQTRKCLPPAVAHGFLTGNPSPSSTTPSHREMWTRNQTSNTTPFGNPAFSLHALIRLAARRDRRRGVNFPAFSTVGSVRHLSSDSASDETKKASTTTEEDTISFAEAKRLMRLVNVEGLKAKLGAEGKEVISYYELLEACESIGVARSSDEAASFAKILDEAGVVLLFRDKVYLHPDKVVDLVRRAVPLALTAEDDPIRNELRCLQEKKEEIDLLAHKQVRRVLWTGLIGAMLQVGLFFRLTFWEFSWDVMEPIAFFSTASGLVIGYAYFLITSRDPTYQDLMKRLFLNRQRKLFRKYDFDCERFKELQRKCKHHLDASSSIRNRVGMDLDLDDALHRD